MIYLNAEVVSGLGEDTFWTWFKREFPSSSFDIPTHLKDDDILLRYSTLGFLPIPGKQIALCWELYPEMKEKFRSDQWDSVITKVYQTARYSTYRTTATAFTVPFYEQYGTVDIIPIGLDTEVFRSILNKEFLRNKYEIPQDKRVGIWVGTTHPMKGFPALLEFARENPDIYWIIIWKWEMEAGFMAGAKNFVKVPQQDLCELINAADFFLSCSKLSTFFMAEWEAMACNIPMVILNKEEKEFQPSANPREDVIRLKWDRKSVKKQWEEYLLRKGVVW